MPKSSVEIGDKFGELTILKFTGFHQEPAGHRRQLVLVQCSCGYIYEKALLYLNRKNGARCCQKCRQHTSKICQIGQKYDKLTVCSYEILDQRSIVICKCECGTENIKIRAKIEDLWKLFESQQRKCALSDLPIKFSLKTANSSTASLDRIDSTKGYTIDNVWWTHKDLNIMKMDFDLNYFIKLCKLVAIKY